MKLLVLCKSRGLVQLEDQKLLLETIYDTVIQVTDKAYLVGIKDRYGLVETEGENRICEETDYIRVIYTDKYIILENHDDGLIRVILTCGVTLSFKVKYSIQSVIIEHSALDYRILEVIESSGIVSIIDTKMGKILGIRDVGNKNYAYRPYNNEIILSFIDVNTKKMVSITKNFDVVETEEAVRKGYSLVEVIKVHGQKRYIVHEKNTGKEFKLNSLGQKY